MVTFDGWGIVKVIMVVGLKGLGKFWPRRKPSGERWSACGSTEETIWPKGRFQIPLLSRPANRSVPTIPRARVPGDGMYVVSPFAICKMFVVGKSELISLQVNPVSVETNTPPHPHAKMVELKTAKPRINLQVRPESTWAQVSPPSVDRCIPPAPPAKRLPFADVKALTLG